MRTTHQNIINLLKERPHTLSEISEKLQKNHNGIRGRISEIRKLGYNITRKSGNYVLDRENPLVTFIKDHNLFNKEVNIKNISIQIDIPYDQILGEVSSLIRNNQAVQLSNNTILVKSPTT